MENNGILDGFDGIGGIILILLFFIMFGNNGFFGNNNQINSDFLYRDITRVNNDVLENRYTTQLGFGDVTSRLQECCCNNQLAIANQTNTLQAQMTANTQAILDKLCATEVQNLRDALAQEQRANLTNTLVSSNQIQTQNILGALLPTPKPAYMVASPYASYTGCGYNQM